MNFLKRLRFKGKVRGSVKTMRCPYCGMTIPARREFINYKKLYEQNERDYERLARDFEQLAEKCFGVIGAVW
jgi:ribosomal protein S26